MKPQHTIAKGLIEDTKCCKYQHACLKDKSAPDCHVVDGRTECCVLVKPKLSLPNCGYHYELYNTSGESVHVCFCDVRKEIYEKFNA